MKQHIVLLVLISSSFMSISLAMQTGESMVPTVTWFERHQHILKKQVSQLFSEVPLNDLSKLEKDIIALGETNGIKNWQAKFDQFKRNLEILGPYIKKNFTVTQSAEKKEFKYQYSIENWTAIAALLGLKPVTTDERVEGLAELESAIQRLSQMQAGKPLFGYEVKSRSEDTGMITIYGQPLIPLSKMMEWYNKPAEWMAIKEKFFELPENLTDENAQNFYTKAHAHLQNMQAHNQQEIDLAFLRDWAAQFDAVPGHPTNQSALILGFQPYAYVRTLNPDESRWQKFYTNQHNYRFLLNPEIIYLDDTTPYVPLYGKIMEYTLRKALGDAFYSYILASQMFGLITESLFRKIKAPKDSKQIDAFLETYFKVSDTHRFYMHEITLGDMSYFLTNFIKAQAADESKND